MDSESCRQCVDVFAGPRPLFRILQGGYFSMRFAQKLVKSGPLWRYYYAKKAKQFAAV